MQVLFTNIFNSVQIQVISVCIFSLKKVSTKYTKKYKLKKNEWKTKDSRKLKLKEKTQTQAKKASKTQAITMHYEQFH